MSFTNPGAFVLLLLLPIFLWIGWPRLAYRRRRDRAALASRLIIVSLIILALAGLHIQQPADRLAVVFLVDVSDSMDAVAQQAALDYVRDAIQDMKENDRAAVVLFGSNALVEHPMDEVLDLSQIGSTPITLNTDLAEAIRLGLALFPADTAKRLVILSDGIETVGNADNAARLAAATDVQIDYVPFARRRTPEVLVTHVQIPSQVGLGEPFDLVVSIDSETDTRADLRILSGGQLVYSEPVDLRAGNNRYSVGPIEWPGTGFVDFRVQIEPLGVDGFYKNNELSAFTRVTGKPRILMVTGNPAEIDYLRPALEGTGLEVEIMAPRELPAGLASLSAYNSIILANVSATELSPDRMDLLEIYVRDLGGGLVVIGGPNSYGVGGYFQTPLEDVLPVEMRIRDQSRIPQLAMVFVLDRSGSMEIMGPSGVANLELAKEAVLRSFDFLNDYDRAGVVSFDQQSAWAINLQEIGDAVSREALKNRIAALRPGGGTNIYGAMYAVSQSLPGDSSTLKHIVLLTDGGSSDTGIVELVGGMYNAYGITTSVVGIGADYAPWLRDVAASGGGNFHVATVVENIPTIFAAETVLATRSYIFEDPFVPTQSAQSPIMEGIVASPQLQGYVATTEKDTATVVLTGPEEDPLLATWQYGLGRSVAFMSDATARWGRDWLNWDQYTRFWNQVVRWTITESNNSNLEAWVEQRGEQAVLVVDARDNRGDYLNELDLDASVVAPDRNIQTLQLQQVAPGRYEATFTPTTEGAYFVRVAGATRPGAAIEASVAQSTGWVMSYSQEYGLAQPNDRFLDELARLTGGTSLEGAPAAAFVHDLSQEQAARPLWPFFLGFAAFVLIVDITIRRVVINQSDIEHARAAFRGRLGMGVRTYQQTETAGRLSGLKEAKRRAMVLDADGESQAEKGARAVARPTPPPQVSEPVTPPAMVSDRSPQAGPASRLSKAGKSKPPEGMRPTTTASFEHSASQLLKKRRGESSEREK